MATTTATKRKTKPKRRAATTHKPKPPTAKKLLGISATTRRRVKQKRREQAAYVDRVEAYTANLPIQVNIYLRPSLIRTLKLEAITRDAASATLVDVDLDR